MAFSMITGQCRAISYDELTVCNLIPMADQIAPSVDSLGLLFSLDFRQIMHENHIARSLGTPVLIDAPCCVVGELKSDKTVSNIRSVEYYGASHLTASPSYRVSYYIDCSGDDLRGDRISLDRLSGLIQKIEDLSERLLRTISGILIADLNIGRCWITNQSDWRMSFPHMIESIELPQQWTRILYSYLPDRDRGFNSPQLPRFAGRAMILYFGETHSIKQLDGQHIAVIVVAWDTSVRLLWFHHNSISWITPFLHDL